MTSKVFSQRFNKELAQLGFPEEINEKTKAVVKVFGVTRYLANSMIYGHFMPPEKELEKIAEILEVSPSWLAGKTNLKKGSRQLSEEV